MFFAYLRLLLTGLFWLLPHQKLRGFMTRDLLLLRLNHHPLILQELMPNLHASGQRQLTRSYSFLILCHAISTPFWVYWRHCLPKPVICLLSNIFVDLRKVLYREGWGTRTFLLCFCHLWFLASSSTRVSLFILRSDFSALLSLYASLN